MDILHIMYMGIITINLCEFVKSSVIMYNDKLYQKNGGY